jgi:hypothetical protein
MTVTPEVLRANKEIRDMPWRFDFVVVDNKKVWPGLVRYRAAGTV